jgi:hypothetical protein
MVVMSANREMSLVDLEEVEEKKFEVELPPDLPLSLSRLSVGHRPISVRRRTRLIIAIDFGTTYVTVAH